MSYIKLEKKFKLLLGTITSVAPLSFVLSCTNKDRHQIKYKREKTVILKPKLL